MGLSFSVGQVDLLKHSERQFLVLQGVASSFFRDLGKMLIEDGHNVRRINFNGGDWLLWDLPHAVDYRAGLAEWPNFLKTYIHDARITDIILFGDCRPLHAAAITVARDLGVKLHIFEEGYLRPDWLTLETQGVNGFSDLPRTIEPYLTAPHQAPPAPEHLPSNMIWRSIRDVRYTLMSLLMSWYYPKYQHYRPYHPLIEYLAGARRLAFRSISKRQRAETIGSILQGADDFYVWPMQIEIDSQITVHSQFVGVEQAIDMVLKSFADQAPRGSKLILTEHPLETSPRNWRRFVSEHARRIGLADRVVYLVNGTPDALLGKSRGVIVINSTVGQKALLLGIPVIALGSAIFNMRGLTFQGDLDRFWTDAKATDIEIVKAYRANLIHRCQINGGLYSERGIKVAVSNAARRITATRTTSEPCFENQAM